MARWKTAAPLWVVVAVTLFVYLMSRNHGDERVAEEPHQQRAAPDRVHVLPREHVDDAGRGERTGRDGDPDEVEDDPEPPGICVGEVGRAAQPEGESGDERDGAEAHERGEENVRGRPELLHPG